MRILPTSSTWAASVDDGINDQEGDKGGGGESGRLGPRGCGAGLEVDTRERPEMLLSAGTCSRHGRPSVRPLSLSAVPWPALGPPALSPPFPAPPSAPSPSMTARWRALLMMSSIRGQAAPQQLAAASPAGGPTMWMQVWVSQGLAQRKGTPEPLLPRSLPGTSPTGAPTIGTAWLLAS